MATILLQAAGAALGSVFGPLGAIVGRAAGALAGSAIDRSILNGMTTVTGARLGDARVPGAEEGTAIPRVYGTMRIGGTLIWATRFEEQVHRERQGGKASGPRVETFRYFANVALGLCEGPIAGIRRVWADGRELDLSTVEMRLHTGAESQAPDPLISAKQALGETPAYRGLAYVVFERLPLGPYGNRIPLLHVEVIRPVGRLEKQIRAVTIIPGATEHGYDPAPVQEKTGPGEARIVNRNVFHGETDWQASLDELQALCPNLKRVALVVSWFGTDLRAGQCRILPGVETRERGRESREWSVAGVEREAAHLVSRNGGGPAYGGTPSDRSVVAAIADCKARGLEVFLYPFVMMDISAANTLPDPYGGVRQAAYPWRGRITAAVAPGLPGSTDKTPAVRGEISAFCGAGTVNDNGGAGGADGRYRAFVLHYARLAWDAGGVNGFVIGSELRGLTTLRDGARRFPFVEALTVLAQDVRATVGPATRLTYAADWSEYFGYHPADGLGDVHFHLDPLWASPAIDAVGIDNYMPLSDWRDGDIAEGNPDGQRTPEDGAKLKAMNAGGEGFDWYYASEADRTARRRTAITDGLAGKPWMFRVKDIGAWWANAHHERIGGVEQAVATAWVPGMKPVWFTETGCPAIDKGSNQPNVFSDPKSSESAVPYFSGGGRSDAVQRRFLEASHDFWQGADAPAGVDPDHMFVWTWDARPQPAFPAALDVWADGRNWQVGHWLNGRLGTATMADTIAAILADHRFADGDTDLVCGDLGGYVQAEQMSARDLLEPLMAAAGIDAVERGGRLVFRSRLLQAGPPTRLETLAEVKDAPLTQDLRGDAGDYAREAILDHLDPTSDYGRTTARSRRAAPGNERILRLSLAGTLHEAAATDAVDAALRDHQAGRRQLSFALPPNALGAMPGDIVTVPEGPSGTFVIERIDDGEVRRVEARGIVMGGASRLVPQARVAANGHSASAAFAPLVHLMDLPRYTDGDAASFARAAVFARPWTSVTLSASPTREGYAARLSLARPARTGTLVAALGVGVSGRFDRANAVTLDLHAGELTSISDLALFQGENRMAVLSRNGAWEILGFGLAEEIAPGRWRLSRLLRGLAGSTDAQGAGAQGGAAIVILDAAVQPLGLSGAEAGQVLNWIVEAQGMPAGAAETYSFAGGLRAETPLAPVHLSAQRDAGGNLTLRWIRCARASADAWLDGETPLDEPVEAYRVEILSGAQVVRASDTTTNAFAYPLAQEIADFGARQSQVSVRVRQRGQVVALGLPGEALLAV
ncbi:baseplate multidomain protein megatron [Rhizobium sp. PP-CC-3G-465]|uniref:baseplate multidomain protein megatron n=1 Tax=Rhizobium sp. PP-CC-3G-465 TaxID=2135648 RepID=UPI001043644D|nr:putative tail protein [Rhizobium sp. PP-CC-3G-465]